MEPSQYRTFATIDLGAIRQNFQIIRQKVGPRCKILSVIKADGYGHGALETAQALPDSDYFGVACLAEAIALREHGVQTPILILGYTAPREAEMLASYQITQCVFSETYADDLANVLSQTGQKLKVHFKIDTGMTRLGFPAKTVKDREQTRQQILRLIQKWGNVLEPEGIFTHFTSSEETNNPFTQTQFQHFLTLTEALAQNGLQFALRHAANSAAIFNAPQTHLDMVRPGIVLYGLTPAESMENPGLIPAMEMKAHIAQLHILNPGETVSYNRTFTADRPMRVATVCVGYADGYPRNLSNRAEVLVNGQRTRLLGTVCMDQCIIDATDIALQPGDLVTLFGHSRDQFLGVAELAKAAHTIHYEIICGVSKRVPRFYL